MWVLRRSKNSPHFLIAERPSHVDPSPDPITSLPLHPAPIKNPLEVDGDDIDNEVHDLERSSSVVSVSFDEENDRKKAAYGVTIDHRVGIEWPSLSDVNPAAARRRRANRVASPHFKNDVNVNECVNHVALRKRILYEEALAEIDQAIKASVPWEIKARLGDTLSCGLIMVAAPKSSDRDKDASKVSTRATARQFEKPTLRIAELILLRPGGDEDATNDVFLVDTTNPLTNEVHRQFTESDSPSMGSTRRLSLSNLKPEASFYPSEEKMTLLALNRIQEENERQAEEARMAGIDMSQELADKSERILALRAEAHTKRVKRLMHSESRYRRLIMEAQYVFICHLLEYVADMARHAVLKEEARVRQHFLVGAEISESLRICARVRLQHRNDANRRMGDVVQKQKDELSLETDTEIEKIRQESREWTTRAKRTMTQADSAIRSSIRNQYEATLSQQIRCRRADPVEYFPGFV